MLCFTAIQEVSHANANRFPWQNTRVACPMDIFCDVLCICFTRPVGSVSDSRTGGCGFKTRPKKLSGSSNRSGETSVLNVKFATEWLDRKGAGILFNYRLTYWDFCKELGAQGV